MPLHHDSVNSIIVENIEEKFGKISCTTGKKHTFLGTGIKSIGGKKVSMTTPHHIDYALEYFWGTLKGNLVNPATLQFFAITDEAKDIDDERKEHYHSITAKIL